MTRHVTVFLRDWREVSLMQAIILFIVAVMVTTGTMWATDKTPPILIIRAEPAHGALIVPGGVMLVNYEVERYRSCASTIDRVLLDSTRVRYPLEDQDWKEAPGPLGRDTFTVLVPIPKSFATGQATYRVIARYECNVLHRYWPIIVSSDVPFIVR